MTPEIAADVRRNIANYRQYAHSLSRDFGNAIDALIVQGTGFGDDPTITTQSVLDQIVNGFNTAASTLTGSVASYYDAQLKINQIRAAAAAGVPLDVYLQTSAVKNTAASIFGDLNSPNMNILGVPIWVILGGVGLFLVLRK